MLRPRRWPRAGFEIWAEISGDRPTRRVQQPKAAQHPMQQAARPVAPGGGDADPSRKMQQRMPVPGAQLVGTGLPAEARNDGAPAPATRKLLTWPMAGAALRDLRATPLAVS